MATKVKSTAVAEDVVKQAMGAKFVIVELAPGGFKPVYDAAGELLKFDNGGDAARKARDLADETGKKYQPRPVTDGNWRERERTRAASKDYLPLPWTSERWWKDLEAVHKDHFPHASISKGACIAFTETEEKGAADIQTPIKPGRYLERFFGDVLGPHVIRDLCVAFSAKYEDNQLMFAETADEMEEVYTNGPSSCMSKGIESYKSSQHPVRAYAAGDIQIAYMKRQGRIVARAVAHVEKKTYNTPYGDSGRLTELLKKEGYKQGAPHGARLARIKEKADKAGLYTFIVPHLDGIGWVRDNGEFLVAGDSTHVPDDGITCGGAVGVSEPVGYGCSCCKSSGSLPQRSVKSVFIDGSHARDWCAKCAKEKAFSCSISGYLVSKDQGVEMTSGSTKRQPLIWSKYFIDKGFVCQGSGKNYWTDDRVVLSDGTWWSKDYFAKHGHVCGCGSQLATRGACQGEDKCVRMAQRRSSDEALRKAKEVYTQKYGDSGLSSTVTQADAAAQGSQVFFTATGLGFGDLPARGGR